MLRHQYPTQPRTRKIVNRVHGGRGMRFGHSQGRNERTTKGFTHVRNKGPPGQLVKDDIPHAVGHKTPDVLLKIHHSTWGGPRDMSANLDHPASESHKPMPKDGDFLHKTKPRKDGQILSTHGSVDYDFLRPNVGYNDNNDRTRISGSQIIQTDGLKRTRCEVVNNPITHERNPRVPPLLLDQRVMTPHSIKKTLRYMKNQNNIHHPHHPHHSLAIGTGKQSSRGSIPALERMHAMSESAKFKNVNKSLINTSRHNHGYNIVNNTILKENQKAFDDYNTTIHEFNLAKQNTTLRPQDTMTGHQGLIPGVEKKFISKTSKPKAIMHSEGYAYNILTHQGIHAERLTRFDKASTKGFRRLSNAFFRKREVKRKGDERAETIRQRRANTIAKTAHVPRRQQNRGFNIINGERWRDIGKHDPRVDPSRVGHEPPSVWQKVSKDRHDRNTHFDNCYIGLQNTAGRAKHTKLQPQNWDESGIGNKVGIARLPDRVTREKDIVFKK
jgi:hypothetical protein